MCKNCLREKIIRSRGLCGGCCSAEDREYLGYKKQGLAAFKFRIWKKALDREDREEGGQGKKALTVQDFYRARLIKEEMREKYGEFFR